MSQPFEKAKTLGKSTLLSFALLAATLSSCKGTYPYSEVTYYGAKTYFALRVYGKDQETKTLLKSMKEKVEDLALRLDAHLSEQSPKTEIAILNSKRTATLSSETINILKAATRAQEETNGLFSPFLFDCKDAVTNFLKKGNEGEQPPDLSKEIESAKNTSLVFEENKVTIKGEASIDLGGIAKGGIIELLKSDLIDRKQYLINGGGSSILLGEKANDKDGFFTVQLEHTGKSIRLKNVAISTSSVDYQNAIVEGTTYSHIINPLTGSLIPKHKSVTLIGGSALMSDAYSTACMHMETEEIKAFCEDKGFQYAITNHNDQLEAFSDTLSFVKNG